MTVETGGVKSPDAPARRPGRPRSAEADDAILAATVDILAVGGYDALTVERVAARAGVAKATVYRRYTGKVELVIAALAFVAERNLPAPDTGSTRGDLEALIDGYTHALLETPFGRLTHTMIGALQRNAHLADAYHSFVAMRRAQTGAVVERAIARGDLRADTDVDLAVDLLAAPIVHRVVVTAAPLDRPYVRALVDAFLRAFAPSEEHPRAKRR